MRGFNLSSRPAFMFALLLFIGLVVSSAQAQAPEYRVYWADAFNSGFKSAAEIDQLLANVRSSNMNAVIVQMRRRGDTYYASNYEPCAPDLTPGFDALAYLIEKAHNGTPRVEVHCWFCTYPIWSSTHPPADLNHAINLHPEWLTQDRYGALWHSTENKYLLDPAVPAVEEFIYNVVMDVVTRYDVDGINFDYIRYLGESWGYNPTAVSRFNTLYNRSGIPSATDSDWMQFRRDQITALLRKIYVNTMAVKPGCKVSADTITWSGGPTTEDGWFNTSAYRYVFQDWRSWMEEGILDINVPMTYYNNATNASLWTSWINYEKTHKYGRHLIIGLGSWLNTIDNEYIQLNDTRTLYEGHRAEGQAFYSYTVPYAGGNGKAAEFTCHLTSTECRPDGPFYPTPVPVPQMPWKISPTKGHIKGNVYLNGNWVDGATVSITGPETRATKSDGTGFFAFVHLTPGVYTVKIEHPSLPTTTRVVPVTAGQVTDGGMAGSNLTPPVISNVEAVADSPTKASISWNTDDGSTGQVEFGFTQSYGRVTLMDKSLLQAHNFTLTGLQPNTLYHFRVKSSNISGLETVSADYTFMTQPLNTTEVIVDNADGSPSYVTTGTWTTSSATPGMWAADYQYVSTTPTDTATATFRPNIERSGPYNVYVWYNSGTNRSTKAPYTIYYSGGTTTVPVNQQSNGSQWVQIAAGLNFDAGTSGRVVLSNGTGESKVVMSDAVKFEFAGYTDTTAPSVPAGLSASSSSQSSISLSWEPSTDDVGVVGYKLFVNGALRETTTQTSYTFDNLAPNTSYTFEVAAYDARGNTSNKSSVTKTTLSKPPVEQNITCDKPESAWQSSPVFVFSSTEGFGPGTLQYYRYTFDTSPSHNWTGSESMWTNGTLVVTAAYPSRFWYLHLQACNADGIPNGTLDIGPYWYDNTPPPAPTVTDGDVYIASSEIEAQIIGTDPESGVVEMKYAIGTTPGGSNVVGWKSVPVESRIIERNLDLSIGTTYYVSVQLKNGAGLWSPVGTGDGETAAQQVDSIASLRTYAVGTPVVLWDRMTSANFGDHIFAQDADRTAGIRVNVSSSVPPGSVVKIGGYYHIVDGVAVLTNPEVKLLSTGGKVLPLGMGISSIGGSDASALIPGIPGSTGPYNIGLLIRIWGKVTSVGTGFFTISDGSGASVKVYSSVPVVYGQTVGVTGISFFETNGTDRIRVILTRDASDVMVYQQPALV